MYKYVETGFTDKFNLPIYKRKRIFRKMSKAMNYLTHEQREEIISAFYLFDKDKSNTIDIDEFKDAMSALGIHLSKGDTKDFLDKSLVASREESDAVVFCFFMVRSRDNAHARYSRKHALGLHELISRDPQN